MRPSPPPRWRISAAMRDCEGNLASLPPTWREALKEWDMIESKIVNEWKAQAAVKAKVEAGLDFLEGRFGAVAPDLSNAIRGCTQLDTLRRWTRLAGQAASVEDFRRDAGL